jgi:membrane associated rhomboid family serine protease
MSERNLAQQFTIQVKILGGFVAVMWILEILDHMIFRGSLNQLGIQPRYIPGLWGILFSPFLHGDFPHLIANTLPFVTLGWFVMVPRTKDFWTVTVITMVISGLGVWFLGARNSVHIGASGLVFGYLGFLLWRGYFDRSMASIAFSLFILLIYGGLIWGILPLQPGVSWEGHFFGFVGGAIAARTLAKPRTT